MFQSTPTAMSMSQSAPPFLNSLTSAQDRWVDAEREYRAAMRLDPLHLRAAGRHSYAEARCATAANKHAFSERITEATSDAPIAQRSARVVLAAHCIDEATINTWRDYTAGGARRLDEAVLLGEYSVHRPAPTRGHGVTSNAR